MHSDFAPNKIMLLHVLIFRSRSFGLVYVLRSSYVDCLLIVTSLAFNYNYIQLASTKCFRVGVSDEFLIAIFRMCTDIACTCNSCTMDMHALQCSGVNSISTIDFFVCYLHRFHFAALKRS